MTHVTGPFAAYAAGLIAFLLVAGIAGLAAAALIKRIFRLDADSRAPRVTVGAKVIGHRQEDRFRGTKYRKVRSSTCYVVFCLDSGESVELWTEKWHYSRLAEGDCGQLTYQGSRFIRFKPYPNMK